MTFCPAVGLDMLAGQKTQFAKWTNFYVVIVVAGLIAKLKLLALLFLIVLCKVGTKSSCMDENR